MLPYWHLMSWLFTPIVSANAVYVRSPLKAQIVHCRMLLLLRLTLSLPVLRLMILAKSGPFLLTLLSTASHICGRPGSYHLLAAEIFLVLLCQSTFSIIVRHLSPAGQALESRLVLGWDC